MKRLNVYSLRPAQIVIFTTSACGDCRMAKGIFQQKSVNYVEIDLEADRRAKRFVKRLNRGFASVPTIIFPDGTVLVEPTLQQLNSRFSE